MTKSISISKDFSKNLGARFKSQGDFSGEEFREKFLEEFFKRYNKGDVLKIDLDGLSGYPSSFFEEAFGGIARKYGKQNVLDAIQFKCEDNPLFVSEIQSYINQK